MSLLLAGLLLCKCMSSSLADLLQIHPDKKMTFRALNEVDYRDWIDLIQKAIAHAVSKGPDPKNNRGERKLIEKKSEKFQTWRSVYKIY